MIPVCPHEKTASQALTEILEEALRAARPPLFRMSQSRDRHARALQLALEALEKKEIMNPPSLRQNLERTHLLLAETFPLTGDHAEILKATEDQFAQILGRVR